jgi:hypothetical protein
MQESRCRSVRELCADRQGCGSGVNARAESCVSGERPPDVSFDVHTRSDPSEFAASAATLEVAVRGYNGSLRREQERGNCRVDHRHDGEAAPDCATATRDIRSQFSVVRETSTNPTAERAKASSGVVLVLAPKS